MNLFDLVVLLSVLVVAIAFWRVRSIGEAASQYLAHYCDQHQLQLISVARLKTRPATVQGKLDWRSVYRFEFSSTGEDAYQGTLTMLGHHAAQIELPPYRIASD